MNQHPIGTTAKIRFLSVVVAIFTALVVHQRAFADIPPFSQGELLVLDSDASQGKGLLFQVDPNTGVATSIGSGFGAEPRSLVLQSPTSLLAADATLTNIYKLSLSTGTWASILTPPFQLHFPSGAMLPDSDHSVLVASGGGNIYRVDTISGQAALYSGNSTLNPWGMARLPDGSLLVGDEGDGELRRVFPDGTFSIVSTGNLLHSIWAVEALPDGTVAVGNTTENGIGSIVRISLQDGSQSYLTPPGSFQQVNGMNIAPDGNLLVADGSGGLHHAGIYEVNLSSGQITTVSTDSKFGTPVAVMYVDLPEPSAPGLSAIAMGLFLLRRRSRNSSRANIL
ncbi:MAG TPA: hypothetical protein VHS31_13125 [Tepidisphaeraceae bacterium]|nr:hypothetical protein [Tepidisphaeraceae bacterium]